MPKQSPRKTARAMGLASYKGKPCIHCGHEGRLVSNNKCITCMAENAKKRPGYRKAIMKRYYERHAE